MKIVHLFILLFTLVTFSRLSAQTTLGTIASGDASCTFTANACSGDIIELAPTDASYVNLHWYINSVSGANEITGVDASKHVTAFTTTATGITIRVSATSGSYIYILTAEKPAGCATNNDVFTINFQPLPTLTIVDPPAVCSPGTVNITAASVQTANSGATTKYYTTSALANAGGAEDVATPTAIAASGTYYIRSEAATGCYIVKPVVVAINPVATVTAGSNLTACESATPSAITLSGASVGGSATTGAWSVVSTTGTLTGTLSSMAQTGSPATVIYTPTASTSGTVTLRLTTEDPTGPCGAVTADRTITVYPLPVVTPGTAITACAVPIANAITLTGASVGGGATTGAWSINGGGTLAGSLSSTAQTATPETIIFNVTPNATGTVTLTLTTNDPNSCGVATATRVITINPFATVTQGADISACSAATASVITLAGASVGGGATTGAWSIVSTTGTLTGTLSSTAQTANPEAVTYTAGGGTSGTVTLRLTTNAAGSCSAVTADRTITINALPDFTLVKPATCPGTSEDVNITALTNAVAATAEYTVDGGTYAAYPSPATLTGLSLGAHTVSIKNAEGCVTTKSVTIDAIVPKTCIPVIVRRIN